VIELTYLYNLDVINMTYVHPLNNTLQQKGSQLPFKGFVLIHFLYVVWPLIIQSNTHNHYTFLTRICTKELNMEIHFFLAYCN